MESIEREVGQTILVNNATITVLGIHEDSVRLGVNAPKELSVHRQETYDRIRAEKNVAKK